MEIANGKSVGGTEPVSGWICGVACSAACAIGCFGNPIMLFNFSFAGISTWYVQ